MNKTSTKTDLLPFSDKCRLCLEIPGSTNLFKKGGLLDDIFSCTGVMISNSINLPQKICSKCCEVIATAKEFRKMVTANETLLKSLFDDTDKTNVRSPKHEKAKENNEKPISSVDTQSHATNLETHIENSQQDSNRIKIKRKHLENTHKSHKKKRKSEHSSSNIKLHSKSPSGSSECKSKSTNLKKISVRSDLFESSVTASNTSAIKEESKANLTSIDGEYKCEICSKVFDKYKKVYLHQRMHNKNMLCPLDMCGKRFSTKGDLEKHIRTHTGERPYNCNICEKKFAQRATLKAHRDNVHFKGILN